MLGKRSSGKRAKKPFLYSHEYLDPKKRGGGGAERAKQVFQKHTNSASKKCWEKIVGNKVEKQFLYSLEYREQKMVGKNARNNFSRNTRIVRAKNVGKKIVGKK